MECKVLLRLLCFCTPFHWNISRMECKVAFFFATKLFCTIGIYPEWNVKSCNHVHKACKIGIGIYPEWNVKVKPDVLFLLSVEHWNISRMECKG